MTATPTESASTHSPADADHRYLQRIDVRAVLIVAAAFNVILGIAFALTGYVVLLVAAQRGVLEQINSALGDLSTDHPLHLSTIQLAFVWTLIVVAWTIAMTIVACLAAMIFNSVLRLSGGVEVDVTDKQGETADFAAHASQVRRWVERSARTTTAALQRGYRRALPALGLDEGLTGQIPPNRRPPNSSRRPSATSGPAANARAPRRERPGPSGPAKWR